MFDIGISWQALGFMCSGTGYSIVWHSVGYFVILKYPPTSWILSFENFTHIKMLIKEKTRWNQLKTNTRFRELWKGRKKWITRCVSFLLHMIVVLYAVNFTRSEKCWYAERAHIFFSLAIQCLNSLGERHILLTAPTAVLK